MSGFSRSNLVRVTVALLALATFHTGLAQEHDNAMTIQVEAQPLASALQDFSEQSGLQVAYVATLAQNVTSKGARDATTPVDALAQILDSTGLEYQFVNDDTVAIGPAVPAEAGGDSDSGNGRTAGETPKPVMMAQAAAERNQANQSLETDSDEDEIKRPLEEIIVTGTNIRGIAPESSPVRIFDREDILISGAATAQDFIQTLTTNFGGGANADLAFGLPDDDSSAFNSGGFGTFGSSVNLRGLGPGATLVLLNGHRLAPSSGLGEFVDISMIPASAIERVEVLTDGASSIYGGDAIAGVTNFILRDDFEGLETSIRYGLGTQNGSPEEFRASVTGGLNWDSGHALVSYEYFNQDEISASDRSFSQSAPLPNGLTPSQERHSVLGSLSQDLTSSLEFFADLTYSRREARRDHTFSGFLVSEAPTSENINISGGGTWKVSNSWFVDFSGTYSKVHNLSGQNIPAFSFSSERETDSDVWSADVKTSGTILRVPGGDLKLAFGGHYRSEDFLVFDLSQDRIRRDADRDLYSAFGEVFIPIVGPDNAVPGIKRLELNVSGRYDDYSDFGGTANPKVGVLWAPVEALRFRGSYSTSFNPPPLGRVGALDFVVSANSTSHYFSLFGLTPADPSLADTVVLTVAGTSPDLDAETSRAFTTGLDFGHQWARHDIAVSTTWFDVEFKNRLGDTPIPGNTVVHDAPNIAFNNPGAFPEGTVIFSPSADQINDVLNSATLLLVNDPPARGDPFAATVINFAGVTRNLGLTQVSGLDLNVMYTFDSRVGELIMGIDGSYLHKFKQQAAVTTPAVEKINTLFNPIDLRLRGRVGYAHDGLAANVFVNYTNDYDEDSTADAMRIDSWTTADLSLSYDTGDHFGNPIWDDTVLRFSVLNLFDQDPPFAGSNPFNGIFGYDPANASALGRFIAFELTKRL